MKGRRLVVLAAAVAIGLVSGGYFYAQGLRARPAFRTGPAIRGPLTAAVSATGTLNAVTTVQVGSQVSGQIKELYVDFNSPVEKGQIVARIDPAMFVNGVVVARNVDVGQTVAASLQAPTLFVIAQDLSKMHF